MVQVTFSAAPRAALIGRRRRSAAALAMLTAALVASAPAAAADKPGGCDPAPDNPMPGKVAFDAASQINIGLLTNALIYYRCTEYDDQVRAVLNEASAWVGARAGGTDKPPAIVLDIDETSLSNWERIYHNRFGIALKGPCDLKSDSACGQRESELSMQATAIQPTLELFNLAQKLKGKNGEPVAVFFITGRFEDPFERSATEWNLRKVGYDNWRGLFMRPESSKDQPVSRYKTLSRIKIEATHTIIANVGDQLSDLSGDQNGDHADRCFKVPNPFYYIPGDVAPGAVLKCMTR
jgi:HAD superfamily, subfamily IIIB (Acid phosphatase)